jgi:multiple antibiotic resistance protein
LVLVPVTPLPIINPLSSAPVFAATLGTNSVAVLAKLGRIGTLVMIRLMAFILLCIGIEIMWTGWAELNSIPT